MLWRRPLVGLCRRINHRIHDTPRLVHTYSDQIPSNDVLDAAILERAALKPIPIRLHDLVKYHERPGQVPPLPELLVNAQYVISELSMRLARRLDRLRALPLIVMLNPHVSEIYNIYYHTFAVISSLHAPQTVEENDTFVDILQNLVNLHSDTIPVLAQGFSQASRILEIEEINQLLWEHLQARIGSRLLAEHHIQLTKPAGPNYIGCIQTDLNPGQMCEKIVKVISSMANIQFGFSPNVKIDMGREVTLAYPPNHLEYILTELLKNAFRAQCSLGEHVAELHPIVVTVIKSGQGVIIRIRDRGGGITPENEEDVFKFAYTTVEREGDGGLVEGVDSSLAGLGFGLPLSKAYAEFFGGTLQLQSYHGWGTDAYLTLKSPMVQGFYRDIIS